MKISKTRWSLTTRDSKNIFYHLPVNVKLKIFPILPLMYLNSYELFSKLMHHLLNHHHAQEMSQSNNLFLIRNFPSRI
jgi:hypothetical protein